MVSSWAALRVQAEWALCGCKCPGLGRLLLARRDTASRCIVLHISSGHRKHASILLWPPRLSQSGTQVVQLLWQRFSLVWDLHRFKLWYVSSSLRPSAYAVDDFHAFTALKILICADCDAQQKPCLGHESSMIAPILSSDLACGRWPVQTPHQEHHPLP
jgi:hypothetical protein